MLLIENDDDNIQENMIVMKELLNACQQMSVVD